jgi:hypothetical protein
MRRMLLLHAVTVCAAYIPGSSEYFVGKDMVHPSILWVETQA